MIADPSLPPTADKVAAALATRWLGRAYEWHAVCSSTSDLAAERARAGAAAGLVIAADAQTGGRGRLGRSWHSPAGENLYLSLLLRPARPAAEIPPSRCWPARPSRARWRRWACRRASSGRTTCSWSTPTTAAASWPAC